MGECEHMMRRKSNRKLRNAGTFYSHEYTNKFTRTYDHGEKIAHGMKRRKNNSYEHKHHPFMQNH